MRSDKRILSLLDASVAENVATMLHVLQHDIDLKKVRAPAAAQEYARRLAQRGVPIAALLRAYRIGSARFQDWCLEELGRSTDDASMISAVGLRIADITTRYIDQVSAEIVSAYEDEKENWLRNLSATRAARVRALLAGERVDVEASETILRYRLRQHHVGVVCWADETEGEAGALTRMEQATVELARSAGCAGRPLFVPQRSIRWITAIRPSGSLARWRRRGPRVGPGTSVNPVRQAILIRPSSAGHGRGDCAAG